MEIIKLIYEKYKNLILYGIIGSLTSSLDFGIFTLLSKVIGMHFLIANCISVFIGIVTSFTLNRAYNFKVKDKTVKRLITFVCVGFGGLCLSNLILWIGIEQLNADKSLTKFASVILVVLFQFLLNKYITFRKKQ